MNILGITLVAAGIAVCASHPARAGEFTGATAPIGQGSVSSYAVVGADGVPTEIGVAFSAGALDGLPTARSNTTLCFDLDGNGAINATGECEGAYDYDLPFPAEVADRADIPFTFAKVDWNPEGHVPPPWLPPHFDLHYYQVPQAAVDAMRVGPCGIFMDCDDFQRAIKPVPAKYINPQHIDVQAAVGRMGNHLIDSSTPELGNPPARFTHTWIFGANDGSIIFHEVMATRSYMALGPDNCADIKQPEAWEHAGYYPVRYCFRHAADGGLKVFMTDFVLRPAG